jgi:hypothetical protein
MKKKAENPEPIKAEFYKKDPKKIVAYTHLEQAKNEQATIASKIRKLEHPKDNQVIKKYKEIDKISSPNVQVKQQSVSIYQKAVKVYNSSIQEINNDKESSLVRKEIDRSNTFEQLLKTILTSGASKETCYKWLDSFTKVSKSLLYVNLIEKYREKVSKNQALKMEMSCIEEASISKEFTASFSPFHTKDLDQKKEDPTGLDYIISVLPKLEALEIDSSESENETDQKNIEYILSILSKIDLSSSETKLEQNKIEVTKDQEPEEYDPSDQYCNEVELTASTFQDEVEIKKEEIEENYDPSDQYCNEVTLTESVFQDEREIHLSGSNSNSSDNIDS